MSSVADLSSFSTSIAPTPQMTASTRAQALKNRELDRTAEDFTAMFLSQMIQPMFETVKTNELFGGSHGEDAMRGFLIQEYGKTLAETDRSGLSSAIKAELIKMQSGGNDDASYSTEQATTNATEVTG